MGDSKGKETIAISILCISRGYAFHGHGPGNAKSLSISLGFDRVQGFGFTISPGSPHLVSMSKRRSPIAQQPQDLNDMHLTTLLEGSFLVL